MARNKYYQGPVSDHFDGLLFHGPAAPADKNRDELLKLTTRTRYAPWPKRVVDPPQPAPPRHVEGAGLRVTAIGHASHLIQTRGLNLLVDPVWSRRASPVPFAGPKRVRAPGIALDHLPPLSAILITHNHYDHLDMPTLRALEKRHRCRMIVPLGNDTILRKGGWRGPVEAHDWGDRVALGEGVAVNLVPCHHWSARWLNDRRMALWAAFVLETPDGPILHVGDTAYRGDSLFHDIRARFGAPRLAVLPIGAYEPRWFMRDHHVDPGESVQIFKECGARHALAHHWGTFRLTAEAIDEPPRRLAEELARHGIAPERFRVLRPGEAFEVPRVGLHLDGQDVLEPLVDAAKGART